MSSGIWTRVPSYGLQHHTIREALHTAEIFLRASRVVSTETLKIRLKMTGFAYLNRACELACAPVHIRPVETSHGLDYAWYTYLPVAQESKLPSEIEPIYLGLESDLTEDQARSKAMGW